MDQQKKNKAFIMAYINAVNGKPKTRELLEKYNADPGLVQHMLFHESVFPCWEGTVNEIMAEGDRVMVRARFRGKHEGEFLGIEATHKTIEFPYTVGYEIQNNKIVHSWLIADYLELMEQLKGKS